MILFLFDQRMSPSLSETLSTRQAPTYSMRGFTLVELMVAVAIMGILASIMLGDWGEVRDKKQVDVAAAKIRGVMAATRLRALATSQKQFVTLHLAGHKVASTTQENASYNSATATWSANTSWDILKKVIVRESDVTGALTSPQPSVKTFVFHSSGSAGIEPGSSTYTVRIDSSNASVKNVNLITVTNATGRVRVKKCTVVKADAGQC